MRKALLIALICGFNFSYSQEIDSKPPTLQIGLDGLSFTKGTLDAQLIMEIIAEKQQELKVKAIQNVFLNKVANSGGTIYSFTDNVVRELVFEKDPKVRTRKILENTVNMVFVYSYLEYYRNTLDDTELAHLNTLTALYNPDAKFSIHTLGTSSGPIMDFINSKKTFKEDVSQIDQEAMEILTLLLDISSEAIRDNKRLQDLGLLQMSYSATYDFVNKYKQLERSENLDLSSAEKTKNSNKLKAAKEVLKDMKEDLESITLNIGYYYYLVNELHYAKNSGIYEDALIATSKFFGSEDLNVTIFENFSKSLESTISEYQTFLAGKNDTIYSQEIAQLLKANEYSKKASKFVINSKDVVYADILYSFYADIRRVIEKSAPRNKKAIEQLNQIDSICKMLAKKITIDEVEKKLLGNNVETFVKLVSTIYKFNEAETISQYLSLIETVSATIPDEQVRNALSTVFTFVKDYSIIETNEDGNEVLNFNVESFIYKLQTIKPYELKRWQFSFTVGVNNAYFKQDLILKDGSVTRNLSFVGEKIGLKYKVYDWSFYRNRNPGETYRMYTLRHPFQGTSYIKVAPPVEPLVSNIHFTAYGSGLLYNLIDSKTNKAFNMPLIGGGLGVTFYNTLDLNVSIGVPILSNQNFAEWNRYPYFNVGFDIQFIEYYQKLMEKRNGKQTQKKLAQALN